MPLMTKVALTRALGSVVVSMMFFSDALPRAAPLDTASANGAADGRLRRTSMGVRSIVPVPPSQPPVGASGFVAPPA